MDIVHRPGKMHKNADGMSRRRDDEHTSERTDNVLQNLNFVEVPKTICKIKTQSDDDVINIEQIQEQDSDIVKVKTWIKCDKKPDAKELLKESPFVKSLLGQWQRLSIRENILVRKWDVLGTDIVQWQCIVPLSYRRTVLIYCHDIKASGHLGIKKTLSKIRQKYYWPGLKTDVKLYIGGCEKCQKRKDPNRIKRAPMHIVRSSYPMERIAIDILGELPISDRGNKYILVIGDYFTKWTECHAMPNMEAKTIAKILIEEVISRFGIPNYIHSDQGRQFESQLFAEMCELLQIKKTRTTPYHPQSDGMVERFNRTLVTMLSTYVNDHHTNWDEMLPYVMMAYRSCEHETTGITPNMCMLVRETTCPLDIMFEMPPSIKPVPTYQYVWEL
jgi:hypothetical protein